MASSWNAATLEEVARFFGVSYQTVRRTWTKDGMPGSRGSYALDEIARWRLGLVAARAASDAGAGSSSDDALEKVRRATAALKGIELQEKRNALIDRERVHIALVKLAAMLRGAGDRLQQDFGTEGKRILDEVLDDFDRHVEEEFSRRDDGD